MQCGQGGDGVLGSEFPELLTGPGFCEEPGVGAQHRDELLGLLWVAAGGWEIGTQQACGGQCREKISCEHDFELSSGLKSEARLRC